MRTLLLALLTSACALAQDFPENLALGATASASSATTPIGGKYGADRINDGDANTHWASASKATLPQSLTLTWPAAVTFDTVQIDVFGREDMNLYALWTGVEAEAGGQVARAELAGNETVIDLRFGAPVEAAELVVRITGVKEPKTYLGIDEVAVYLDREGVLKPPPPLPSPVAREDLMIGERRAHPCVFYTPDDVARARRNAEQTEWGRQVAANVIREADRWLQNDEGYWLQFLPEPGACYAYGFTGAPTNGATWGTWGGARCSWDDPGHVTTTDGQRFPNEEYPDDGTGYKAADGRIHYFVGSWNAWVTEQWSIKAVPNLAHAYALTGEQRYAERAAFFLDILASIYPESSSGSWDYPSSPPSGRFARPWYQVARVLTPVVEAYDLIYESDVLDQPSRRPALEQTFPAGPTPQQRAVGTDDRHGVSRPDMTRRENIDENMILDGAQYCYKETFKGILHNGHSDYMRGALAAGALLNVPTYVDNAIDSPWSIYAHIANNADRDGHYYETSVMYALHARNLYLTFVDPLRNWRDERHPNGINLADDRQFLSFYRLPALSLHTAGREPNFGDVAPDNDHRIAPERPFHENDFEYAERMYAITDGAEREVWATTLRWLADGDVERQREQRPSLDMLYRADPVPPGPAELPEDLARMVDGSWFLGQKGIGLLRNGERADAQAALLRFGPSLNHGQLDDLGLIYYAKGWQMVYEIGYGLGSTHTQVGWARQTASHALVNVNETSQQGGSGGSLHLFARLPGLRLVEADSPLSYAKQDVTQYRRTVAMLGHGEDQVLVDLFRVAGGRQHDYLVGGQSREVEVAGVELGEPQPGSLAGPDIEWGKRQGNDGDMKGEPGKPYWNPPPGNGYGFLVDPRFGEADQRWTLDWSLGEPNDAHFRVHFLPEAGSRAIVADAPGLYPRNRPATYGIVRRTGDEGLVSRFASVMEPYARRVAPGIWRASDLGARVADATQTHRYGSGYGGYYFFRALEAGDRLDIALPVRRAGAHRLAVDFLHYPSYGTVQVKLDGLPVGDVLDLRADEATPMQRVELGTHELAAGDHTITFEAAAERPGIFGVQAITLQRPDEVAPDTVEPVVELAERLTVADDPDALVVHLRRAGRDEYLLSSLSDEDRTVSTPHGELSWRGGAAYVAFDAAGPVAAATVGSGRLAAPGLVLEPAAAALRGRVTGVDVDANTIDLDVELPTAGLEGEPLIFSRPEWSRTSAYRIARVERTDRGSRVSLGTQTTVLGRGRIYDVADSDTLLSDIPHEYNRSVVGQLQPRFFDGKRLIGENGAETRVRTMIYGQPMQIEVEDTSRFKQGERVAYHDLGPGDSASVPTTVWIERGEGGAWRHVGSVAATVTTGDERRELAATGVSER